MSNCGDMKADVHVDRRWTKLWIGSKIWYLHTSVLKNWCVHFRCCGFCCIWVIDFEWIWTTVRMPNFFTLPLCIFELSYWYTDRQADEQTLFKIRDFYTYAISIHASYMNEKKKHSLSFDFLLFKSTIRFVHTKKYECICFKNRC